MKTTAKNEDSSFNKDGLYKTILLALPLVLIVALMVACLGGGLLFMFYSIVTAVAFHSAMIYLIVAGAAAILLGAGLGLIVLFKKYLAFYNKKTGRAADDNIKKTPAQQKTVTYDKKTFAQTLKKYLTVPNAAIAILALGSLFAIISALLGCTDRSSWVKDVGNYRQERSYYAKVEYNVEPFSIHDNISLSTGEELKAVNRIDFVYENEDDINKNVVVIYTKNKDRANTVSIEGYKQFADDYTCSISKSGKVTVHIGTAPVLNSTLDKLLFFMFDSNYAEKQILVYVPYNYKVEISQIDREIRE